MNRLATERSDNSFRWGFMRHHTASVEGEEFINRRQIIQTPWFAVLLTRIGATDKRDPHDHSRTFASFILRGGYTELVYDSPYLTTVRVRTHKRFSCHILKHTQAHRIIQIEHPLTTLVFAGKWHGVFNFWTAEGKIPWPEYNEELS